MVAQGPAPPLDAYAIFLKTQTAVTAAQYPLHFSSHRVVQQALISFVPMDPTNSLFDVPLIQPDTTKTSLEEPSQ